MSKLEDEPLKKKLFPDSLSGGKVARQVDYGLGSGAVGDRGGIREIWRDFVGEYYKKNEFPQDLRKIEFGPGGSVGGHGEKPRGVHIWYSQGYEFLTKKDLEKFLNGLGNKGAGSSARGVPGGSGKTDVEIAASVEESIRGEARRNRRELVPNPLHPDNRPGNRGGSEDDFFERLNDGIRKISESLRDHGSEQAYPPDSDDF